jgi:MFS superfamily sulfate permease-like transporter
VTSAFEGFPGCVSLSRCVILDGLGGRSQLNGFFAGLLLLVVILFLGPLFEALPKACLAAIIVIALKNMVLEVFTEFPKIFRKSKIEGVSLLLIRNKIRNKEFCI